MGDEPREASETFDVFEKNLKKISTFHLISLNVKIILCFFVHHFHHNGELYQKSYIIAALGLSPEEMKTVVYTGLRG